MTVASALPTPSADPSTIDHFVYLHGVSWHEYEAVLAMRGERSVPRVTYSHGVLELMSPSRYHASDKKKLARLIESWAEEQHNQKCVGPPAPVVRARAGVAARRTG